MTRFGVALHEASVPDALDAISVAEEVGLPIAWLTSSTDQLLVFAVAAERTRKIKLGTAIVPTFPRHPVLLLQQVAAFESLSQGRLELGIGPSHRPIIEGQYGLAFKTPLQQTREYALILQQAMSDGKIDFEGEHFRVHVPSIRTPRVPLLLSALRTGSFRTAGEVADGAISWVCPAPYLREQALPALRDGAQAAGRPQPRLVGHCFLAVNTDTDKVREDARSRLRIYPMLPFYASMLKAAGDAEAATGVVSNRMIESVVAHGTAGACADRLVRFADEAGADDLIVSLMVVEGDRRTGLRQAMEIVASLNRG